MPASQLAVTLPDALIVRYFRAGELDHITVVSTLDDGRLCVSLDVSGEPRADTWRDLGGGIGYVPDVGD